MYRLRGDELRQVTKDHSLLQEADRQRRYHAAAGEAVAEQESGLRARSVSIRSWKRRSTTTIRSRETFICSVRTAFVILVSDDDIGLALQTLSSNLKTMLPSHLVQTANDNGGRDNISVILVRVLRDYPAPRSIVGKMMSWFK